MFKNTLLLLTLWLLIAPPVTALPLVKEGQPLAEIIVPEEAHPALHFAATELQKWVEAITGARLPLLQAPEKAPAKIRLLLNPSAYQADLDQIGNSDGYAVRQCGDELLIATRPKGIINGVFRLLYRNSDIIWARPNPDYGTIYSQTPDLTLSECDYIDIPRYLLRGWQISAGRDLSNEEWLVHNCCNWSADSMRFQQERVKHDPILEYGGGHNLIGRYIPEKKYYDTHPQFYSLKEGQRLRHSTTPGGAQLCFTLPELQQTFIEELDGHVKANLQYDTFRIMIEDNHNVCQCEGCLAPLRLPTGEIVENSDPAFRSTQFFIWLNPIARHLKQQYNKDVLAFAYFFTEQPPRCPLEPNIHISFCPIGKNSKHPITHPANRTTLERFEGWLKVTPNLTWREYYGLCGPFPRPIDTIALQDWRYIADRGIRRTYSEMRPDLPQTERMAASWHMNALYFWVMTQGPWQPERPVAELRQEFLSRVFGAAAADVAEFYRLIEEQWFALPGHSSYGDSAYRNWQKHVFATDVATKCQAALKRAGQHQLHPHAARMLADMEEVVAQQLWHDQGSVVHAVKTTTTPDFDPAFESTLWQQATPNSRFLDSRTEELYQHATLLRVLYDAGQIYFGFRCAHPTPATMNYSRAEPGANVFPTGESFEIFLEGEWRGERHFTQMVINPVNDTYRAVRRAVWTSEAAITAEGWSGMIVLPWSAIGVKPEETSQLKATFIRHVVAPRRKGVAPPWHVQLPGGRRHSMSMTSRLLFE